MGFRCRGPYLGDMTTYTTPHFANGSSDRNVRPAGESFNRPRPAAAAASYRTAGVSNEGAALAEGPTADWQPGNAKGGVPKAAIGALGAALVGGVALAIVLLAPSAKVTKQVMPDPIAQAAAQNTATQKPVDSTTAAATQLDDQAPAAGVAATDTSATQQRAQDAAVAAQAAAQPAAVTAPLQAQALPVVHTPVVHAPRRAVAPVAPVATQRVTPQPMQDAPVQAPAITPDVPTPQAQPQAPAMQQTPDAPTVTPLAPAPADPAPASVTPDPAPAQ